MRHLFGISLFIISLSATQGFGAACSQLPHWSWPPQAEAKRFSAMIGNHEGVLVRYFMDTTEPAQVIEVTRYGFRGQTQFLWRSDRDAIAVTIKGPTLDSYLVNASDPRYGETLLKMRDLLGYAGGPQSYKRPEGSANLIVEDSIQLVDILDGLIAAQGPQVFNCILYDTSNFPPSGETCSLTNGPLGSLGSWDARARAVWIRKGYELILVDRAHFDKSGGTASFLSSRVENDPSLGREIDGGFYILLQDAVSVEASSLFCQRSQP